MRVSIEIDDANDAIIKLMTRKSYMTNTDYQKFFLTLLMNAARNKK